MAREPRRTAERPQLRWRPVDNLVPIDFVDDIVITKPAPGAPLIGRIKLPKPPKIGVDVVELLLQDRNSLVAWRSGRSFARPSRAG